MAKVTLYVSDDLWQRARKLGDDTNLSQVFQAALKSELRQARLRREEADLLAAVDLQALRARFDRERAVLYRRGFEIGLRRAGNASYAELRYCAHESWDRSKVLNAMVGDDIFFDLEDASRELAYEITGVPPENRPRENLTALTQDPTRSGVALEVGDGFIDALRRVWELTTDDVGGS